MILKIATILFAILSISCFCLSAAFAGRPLLIDDAIPIAQSHFDLELGLTHAQPHRGGRSQSFPAMTLAYGFFERLEFGMGLQRINSDPKGEQPVKGFEDLHLNSKYKFLDEGPILPTLAFTLDLKIPTANRRKGLSTGRVDENFVLLATKNLKPLALDLNFGYLLVDSPPTEKLKNRIHGGSALRWAAHERWELVGEIFGLSRQTKGDNNEANFQVGFRYRLIPSLIWDAAIDRSLRPTGARIQGTLGLTWTASLF